MTSPAESGPQWSRWNRMRCGLQGDWLQQSSQSCDETALCVLLDVMSSRVEVCIPVMQAIGRFVAVVLGTTFAEVQVGVFHTYSGLLQGTACDMSSGCSSCWHTEVLSQSNGQRFMKTF